MASSSGPPPLGKPSLPTLEADLFSAITAFGDTKTIAALAESAPAVRDAAYDDVVWQAAYGRDFPGCAKPPNGAARQAWLVQKAAVGDAFPHYAAASSVVGRLTAWAAAHFPAVNASLRRGAAPSALAAAEAQLGLRLPPALKALYLIVDGQGPAASGSFGPRVFTGLLGGAAFYDEVWCTRLLPLAEAVDLTLRLRAAGTLRLRHRFFIFAASFQPGAGTFVVDCRTGQVYAMAQAAELLPAVPSDDASSSSGSAAGAGGSGGSSSAAAGAATSEVSPASGRRAASDSVLRWLGEYARRLEAGVYRVRTVPSDFHAADEEDDDDEEEGTRSGGDGSEARAAAPAATSAAYPPLPVLRPTDDAGNASWRMISLYPEAGPETSLAVTQGVHVLMSCLFVPHMSLPAPPASRHGNGRFRARGSGAAAVGGGTVAGQPAGEAGGAASDSDGEYSANEASGHRRGTPLYRQSYRFTYRARLWMTGDSPHASAQLAARHWVMRDATGNTERVDGDGVIGLYPHLRPLPEADAGAATGGAGGARATAGSRGGVGGGAASSSASAATVPASPADASNAVVGESGQVMSTTDEERRAADALRQPFEYSSATVTTAPTGGSMQGSFTMHPGGLAAGGGAGAPFEAEVALWRLDVPEFIF